jgi:phosphoglycolate phosphatase
MARLSHGKLANSIVGGQRADMSDFPFDVVVFDLDGTLADTLEDITGALNRTLSDLDRPTLSPDEVRPLIGGGSKALLHRAMPDVDEAYLDRTQTRYLDHYAAHICVGTRPYSGVEAAMDALAARGVQLAICTNKAERLTHALVAALDWQDRFAAIVCPDTLQIRKPDPAPLKAAVAQAGGGRAVLIGDSSIDAETARNAGLPFVAFGLGFADRPLGELGADAVINAYEELVPALIALGRVQRSRG